jgi:lipoprotein-anchoring transpeptidase ErfK/SrfK
VIESVPHELLVDVKAQSLYHLKAGVLQKEYLVSTAKNGVGEKLGSEQTPRGWHFIRAKIGGNQPANTIFQGRRPTGEIYSERLNESYPERDWILTRILWLCGMEVGFNRFGECDTMKRYIYIHGSPDSKKMGQPSSKGCINMHNKDLIQLYSELPVGTKVFIRG